MQMSGAFKIWLRAFVQLFFPRHCVVCGDVLREGEEALCMHCNIGLPRTNYHLRPDNPVERMFWGKFPLERATAYFFYRRGSGYRGLLHRLKYEGRKDLGLIMGRFMGADLSAAGFFRGIDVLVPVPLHPRKLRERGYNQSEYIARGLAEVTGLPVDVHAVVRSQYTESQTHKSAYDRWAAMDGVFRLLLPESFENKHVLLIDDVLTTGATLTACADVFTRVPGVRVSVLTLSVTA